jgi:glycosyltransferase involved in cell wall biosynthesis
MRDVDVSILVCTWNRAALLRRCLQALSELEVPPHLHWEVLVVNNNSTDDTVAVVADFYAALPVRLIHEPNAGLSHARNTAVANASGRLLAWIDDDVAVDRTWLREHINAAALFPQYGYFGGRIIPQFESAPPTWVRANQALLARPFTSFNLGTRARPFANDEAPVGANMVIRAEMLAGYRFDPNLGRKADQLVGSEEESFFRRMRARGVGGLWVPTASVIHFTMNDRLQLDYLRSYFLALGQAQARIGSGVLGRIARLPWQPLGSISFATLAALYRGALKLLEALDHPKSIGYDLRLQQIRGAAMESQEDLKR